MRPELTALAVIVMCSPARGDVIGMVAVDTYLATSPSLTTDDAADVAWSAHAEWREPERGVVLDWVERESLVGSLARRELHELSYTDRSIDHLVVTLGRFRVPGGFWLMADGGEIAGRWDALEIGAYGGSRSFTNARVDTLLSSSPSPLPLVGATASLRGDVQAALSYTATADRVSLYRGDGTTSTTREPEQFIDAELLAPIGAHLYVTAGATIGSRYLVTYSTLPSRIADDPQLENVWFGSQAIYALVDWRTGDWRLDGSAAALRTKLGQVTAEPDLAEMTGSYVETTLRATWHRDRQWRIDARYRARVWADLRQAHRAQTLAQWRRGELVVQVSAGIDVHEDAGAEPGLVDGTSLLYRASVGRKTARSDVALGVAAVSTIGDEVSAGPGDDNGDTRAPYTLEARSYAFLDAFFTRGAWFGGFDGELDLHGGGARALVQLGCSR